MELQRRAGLVPLERFQSRSAWQLTRCLECGCEAHYRFEYVLDQMVADTPVCRACHWRRWAAEAYPVRQIADVEQVRTFATEHGYEYLEPLTAPSQAEDPHRVRCRQCLRISAERTGDIGRGCPCQKNPTRSTQTDRVRGAAVVGKELFKDSGSAAVSMWDHDQNDESWWLTATVRARREVSWLCPCGNRFTEKIMQVGGASRCLECRERTRAEAHAQREVWKRTPVSKVSELQFAWADEVDPSQVMVAGGWRLYRFRCPQGHSPRMRPSTYLRSGCPSCRGSETRKQTVARHAEDPAGGHEPEVASQWHPTRNGK